VNFDFSPAAEALRSEIRSVLAEEWPLGRLGYREPENQLDYPAHRVFRRRLARHGWFGIGIPEEYGGRGGTKEMQYVVAAELAYHGVPYPEVAVNMVAHTILHHGSDDLKRRFLPRIAAGEIEFSLGLSEPNAGSDLASLRTVAAREAGRWVINGQKIYTSYIHRSEYCLMAVRTDPAAPRHRGISLLVVDVTTPGIGVRPLWGMGDIRTNLTFWDNVEVPEENLVGEENRGWSYLNTHLDIERLTSFTVDALRAPFDDLVAHVRATPGLRADPHVRELIGQLSAEVEVLETLSRRTLWMVDTSGHTRYESSQVKVVATELRQKLARLGLEILGEAGQLAPGDPAAPLAGAMLRAAEAAVMQTYGAGANEIQRDIIARRGLDLGRSA
jgi:alkylation response protein AidB-like acyl-CoA dehydrogenase